MGYIWKRNFPLSKGNKEKGESGILIQLRIMEHLTKSWKYEKDFMIKSDNAIKWECL